MVGAERSGADPRVEGVSDHSDAPFIALEWIEAGKERADADARFGRDLAELHRTSPSHYGLDHDNFIGILPQDNRPCDAWHEFLVLRRLEPQLKMAVDSGRSSMTLRSRMRRLFSVIEDRIGDPQPPAHLHGDLWAGNRLLGSDGYYCLIDPAVYGGCREMDLAMMRLFGGFSERVFSAYDEVYPFPEGLQERIPLYQLYPVLVHVNLFGGHYVDQAENLLRSVL